MSLTMVLPNGVNAIPANLKCWRPKGMPMMVQHSNKPKNRCVRQMGMPANSHRIFMMVLKQPGCPGRRSTLLPNGHSISKPNLKTCKPKGMKMMVIQSTTPTIKYSKAVSKPPQISHMILPITFIILYDY